MFYIGCPMWGYKEWTGSFFPARTPASDFLRLYSRRLNTVEGNTAFYALPSAETVSRWRQETPETFRFCPKVSRDISHAARLDERRDEALAFVERMRGLGTRLGPIFLQLPPAFGPAQLAQLQAFLDFWPREVRLAVEVRHPDFFAQAHAAKLNELLDRYNVTRVLMDTRPIRVGPAKEQQVLQGTEAGPPAADRAHQRHCLCALHRQSKHGGERALPCGMGTAVGAVAHARHNGLRLLPQSIRRALARYLRRAL